MSKPPLRLRRLVRNRLLTGALVVLAVIVAGIAGNGLGHTGGYASGYSTGYSDGNPDYNKIQESIKSTELNYYGYLQLVLSKLAVDSQNKSANSPNAGFDSLYCVQGSERFLDCLRPESDPLHPHG